MTVSLIVDTAAAQETLKRLMPKLNIVLYHDDLDLNPFSKMFLLLWPSAGKSFEDLGHRLTSLEVPPSRISVLDIEDSRTQGWDAYQAEQDGMDVPALEAWINARSRLIWPADAEVKFPFKCLGYNRTRYYFMPRGTGQVVDLGPKDLAVASFMHLKPDMAWWRKTYPKKDDEGNITGIAAQAASADLILQCQRQGLFTPNKIRGRGVWIDSVHGRKCAVVHAGNRVLAEGRSYEPYDIPARYIYEISEPLIHDENAEPLSMDDAKEMQELISELGWKTKEHALLFTGWLICAIVGGALAWRPHIWVSGRRGSGKSTVVDIVKLALGSNFLALQGFTSEAGIRQSLGHDGLPVLIDEAEKEDQASASRIQAVLQLMRGGTTAKGTPSGKAMTFEMRSCFALSSINSAATKGADRSRVTVLEVGTMMAPEAFDLWKKRWGELTSGNFADRLYALAVRMTPTLRHNAIVMAAAVSRAVGEQRMGDQIGTLLAGQWSLLNAGTISHADARAYVAGISLRAQKEELAIQSDEQMLLDHLMEIVVELHGTMAKDKRSIGEMVYALAGLRTPWNHTFGIDAAETTLKQHGIRIIDDKLVISNSHTGVGKLLRDTRWEGVPWHASLLRLEDAFTLDKPVWFAGSSSRATAIPLRHKPEPLTSYRPPEGEEEILLPFDDEIIPADGR